MKRYDIMVDFISGVMFGVELASPEEEDTFDWGLLIDLGIIRIMFFSESVE